MFVFVSWRWVGGGKVASTAKVIDFQPLLGLLVIEYYVCVEFLVHARALPIFTNLLAEVAIYI